MPSLYFVIIQTYPLYIYFKKQTFKKNTFLFENCIIKKHTKISNQNTYSTCITSFSIYLQRRSLSLNTIITSSHTPPSVQNSNKHSPSTTPFINLHVKPTHDYTYTISIIHPLSTHRTHNQTLSMI